MIIPWQQLSPDTLHHLLEEYASRDGTDYGEQEVPLAVKVDQLRGLLKSGEVVLVYDPALEGTNLVTRQQAAEMGLFT